MARKQTSFNLFKGSRGGRRPGAGRKRIHSQGVAHRKREAVSSKTPLHINFKFKTFIRTKGNLKLLKKAIQNARIQGLRINHFSLQGNHVHLIVEASHNSILTKGMRSLTVTFAKGFKKGKVQIERYHLHVLKTVRETKNAVFYVLFNKQKHEKGTYSMIDGFSSLLSMGKAMALVSNYARSNKITLKVGNLKDWKADAPESFLLKRGIKELVT